MWWCVVWWCVVWWCVVWCGDVWCGDVWCGVPVQRYGTRCLRVTAQPTDQTRPDQTNHTDKTETAANFSPDDPLDYCICTSNDACSNALNGGWRRQQQRNAPLVSFQKWTRQTVLVNNQLDAQFFFSCMFIPILYMFRELMCSSSGELIVSIHLVFVTVCRWPSGVQICTPDGHLHTVTYTRCPFNIINSPDDEHMSARNM